MLVVCCLRLVHADQALDRFHFLMNLIPKIIFPERLTFYTGFYTESNYLVIFLKLLLLYIVVDTQVTFIEL